jgi:hypothetical protein
MLKNRQKTLPPTKTTTVYVPRRHKPPRMSFFGQVEPASLEHPVSRHGSENR